MSKNLPLKSKSTYPKGCTALRHATHIDQGDREELCGKAKTFGKVLSSGKQLGRSKHK